MPKDLDTKRLRPMQIDTERAAALCVEHRLTPRQTAFVMAFVERGNAAAAYRIAYDVKPGATARHVTKEAARLVRTPKMAPIVHELQRATVDAVVVDIGITKAMITAELAKMGFWNRPTTTTPTSTASSS